MWSLGNSRLRTVAEHAPYGSSALWRSCDVTLSIERDLPPFTAIDRRDAFVLKSLDLQP